MSQTRETVKHAAIYSMAGMLGKMIGFIMLPFYAHNLGTEGYGVVGMVDASIMLLTSLLAYGCQGAITRIYHEQPDGKKAVAVSTGYWIVFAITMAMVLISMAASSPISALLFGDSSLSLILCMALLSFWLDMSGQTASTFLLIRRQSMLYSLISLLRLISGLSMNIAFIVVLEWGVYGYFLSSLLTALLTFIVFQRLCFRDCGTAYDKEIAKEILRFQLPMIPSALISFASSQSERIILRFIESIEKVGVLEMGYKFPSLLQLLIHTPLMNSWNTERIRIAEEGNPDAPRQIGDMLTLSFYLMALGGLLIALCIGDVLVILTPEGFWEAKRIAQIECLTLIVASITYHANFGYLFTKDSKGWASLTAGTSVIKIGLSFLFISWLGILGAAYSALVTAILLLAMSSMGGQRRYHIEHRHRANLLIAATGIMIFCIAEVGSESIMNLSQQAAAALSSWLRGQPTLATVLVHIPAVVFEKLPYMIDAVLRAMLGLLFLLLLPYVHPSVNGWLRTKFGKSQPSGAAT